MESPADESTVQGESTTDEHVESPDELEIQSNSDSADSSEGDEVPTSDSPEVTDSSEVTQKLTALETELAEIRDKYLRALAELDNYRKRALRERSDLLKYQGEPVLFDFLAVLDNLELALQHSESEPDRLKAGLELIHKQFVDVLKKWEVRPKSALGEEFSPETHGAISRVALDDAPPGTVINEPKKAYFYKDKLLRAGEAVVATGRQQDETAEDALTPDEGEDKEEQENNDK